MEVAAATVREEAKRAAGLRAAGQAVFEEAEAATAEAEEKLHRTLHGRGVFRPRRLRVVGAVTQSPPRRLPRQGAPTGGEVDWSSAA